LIKNKLCVGKFKFAKTLRLVSFLFLTGILTALAENLILKNSLRNYRFDIFAGQIGFQIDFEYISSIPEVRQDIP